ncbi:MAG: hypothetical protein ABI576_21250 [Flavobacterium sp.]
MKKIFYLLVCLIIYSCKSQNVVNVKSQDIFIFDFEDDNIKSIQNIIFLKDNLIISSKKWGGVDLGYGNFKKQFEFIKNKDTMNLKIKNQYNNLYLKNIQFKKGNYELDFLPDNYKNRMKILSNYIKGNQIETTKEVQNIFFNNAFIESTGNPITSNKNLYFKDLKFIEIDLKDSTNVKVIKVN